MEENGGEGRVWTIDPSPRVTFDAELFRGRVEIVQGLSLGLQRVLVDRSTWW